MVKRQPLCVAKIIEKEPTSLNELCANPEFFTYDTNTVKLGDAIQSLQSFYQNPIEKDERLTIYWLLKQGKPDEYKDTTNMLNLPFSSRKYDKLNFQVFPTIRRTDKYGSVGSLVLVIIPEGDK